jgi:hypothetical protein
MSRCGEMATILGLVSILATGGSGSSVDGSLYETQNSNKRIIGWIGPCGRKPWSLTAGKDVHEPSALMPRSRLMRPRMDAGCEMRCMWMFGPHCPRAARHLVCLSLSLSVCLSASVMHQSRGVGGRVLSC